MIRRDDPTERHADPTARALALLSLLQTHRHWRGAELASQLGVSERTLRRDVERLRGLGYPVDATPGVDGGYQLTPGATVPPLLLDDDEAVALVVGVRAGALASIAGIEDTSVRLMAKLDQMLPDRVRRRVDALHSSIEVLAWTPHAEPIPVATLTVLGQACRDREEIRFGYLRRDGEESQRLVQPAQLVSAGRRWYLVAWDVRRDAWRTFRVDRIDRPALAGVRFDPRQLPAADAATFVAEGMRAMATEHRATVVVDAPIDRLAATVRWLGADAVDLDGSKTRLTLRAESLEWLAATIAILAIDVDLEIIDAPDEVRNHLLNAVSRLGEQTGCQEGERIGEPRRA